VGLLGTSEQQSPHPIVVVPSYQGWERLANESGQVPLGVVCHATAYFRAASKGAPPWFIRVVPSPPEAGAVRGS
jgi:hypothetical protein